LRRELCGAARFDAVDHRHRRCTSCIGRAIRRSDSSEAFTNPLRAIEGAYALVSLTNKK